MKTPREILAELELSPEGRAVAEVLVERPSTRVGFRTIAKRTGLDLNTIDRVLRGLEASGLVKVCPAILRDEQGVRVVTMGTA